MVEVPGKRGKNKNQQTPPEIKNAKVRGVKDAEYHSRRGMNDLFTVKAATPGAESTEIGNLHGPQYEHIRSIQTNDLQQQDQDKQTLISAM